EDGLALLVLDGAALDEEALRQQHIGDEPVLGQGPQPPLHQRGRVQQLVDLGDVTDLRGRGRRVGQWHKGLTSRMSGSTAVGSRPGVGGVGAGPEAGVPTCRQNRTDSGEVRSSSATSAVVMYGLSTDRPPAVKNHLLLPLE